jgi:histidine triad (HIT) family protein
MSSNASGPVKALADRRCAFCPIVRYPGAAVTKIYTDLCTSNFLVIEPLGPETKGHVLVIPHDHVISAKQNPRVYGRASEYAASVADRLYPNTDVNIIVNDGLLAGQTVPHVHIHVFPRRSGDQKLMPWDVKGKLKQYVDRWFGDGCP